VIVVVNLFFLALGVLLYAWAAQQAIALPEKGDQVFAFLAFGHLGPVVGVMFILGLIAAAYSSADGSLTALTTSFCLDILGMSPETSARGLRTKTLVHWGMALLFVGIILLLRFSEAYQTKDFSVISLVLNLAGYTYGPLLGLYAFGLSSQRPLRPWADRYVPAICLASPLLCWALREWALQAHGYTFGFELLLLNGLFTFVALALMSRRKN
jgi:Na+/proline symporter